MRNINTRIRNKLRTKDTKREEGLYTVRIECDNKR